MTPRAARLIDAAEIPVIDIAPLRGGEKAGLAAVAAQLRRAAVHPGFFYVRNHGVPAAVIEGALAASKAFFARPDDDKARVGINRRHRGWLRVGAATMKGSAQPDLKESYVWALDLPEDDPVVAAGHPLLGPNNWPDFIPGFGTRLTAFHEAASGCARDLMRAFAVSLGLPGDFFLGNLERPLSRGAVVYYPAQEPMGDRFGVGPHTDYGCLTLVWQDSTGGLEVRTREGEWVTAHPIPDTLVVNVGDLLARWSNDTFVSTPHRVVNRAGTSRYSMALFFDPDFDTVVDPAGVNGDGAAVKYAPVTCGEYILERYAEAFKYRTEEASPD